MELMTDGPPHGIVLVSASQKEQGLCERCQALEIGTYLEKSGKVDVGWPVTIPKSSLRPDCRFCQQFREMFRTANPSGRLAETSVMDLSREPLPSLAGEEPCRRYYLTVLLYFDPQKSLLDYQQLHFHPIPMAKFLTPNIHNFDMVKQALHNCEKNHTNNCQPLSTMCSILQLIDCKSRKIIPAHEGQRYVCLTYVWGPDKGGEKTSPLELPSNIPKTIEDSMYVAIEIGIPFLWVDRYCIDQTNLQQKHTIIQNMDKIYSGADLTIISSVGEDPHHGLPGVHGTPRQSQFQLQGEFCTYLGVPTIKEEIEKSKWSSRGWTYQEMLLSRRRLVFTSTQMYFQCTLKDELESLQSEQTNDIFQEDYQAFPSSVVGEIRSALIDRLHEYFQRQLSFESDIINAFLGVINAFEYLETSSDEHPYERVTATHFYGVPILRSKRSPEIARYSFLQGLSWALKLSSTSPSIEEPTSAFPSWTWASIKATEFSESHTGLYFRSMGESGWNDLQQQGIDVMLWDRHKGALSLDCFANSVDFCTDLQPWLDITTWTRSYTVLQLEVAHRELSMGVTFDTTNRQHIGITAVCLTITDSSWHSDEILWVDSNGLLVIGTGKGTYRRIGSYDGRVEITFENLMEDVRKSRELERAPVNQMEAGAWRSPKVLTAAGWQRNTMRLV